MEARIEIPGEETRSVRWELPVQPNASADFLLPLMLLIAMRTGNDLHLDAVISEALMNRVGEIQALLRRWDASLDVVRVESAGTVMRSPHPHGPGIGSCFSGGVDSFHTALQHQQELTSLVYVQGFDVRHTRSRLLSRVRAANEAAAGELGLRLLVVSTDVRDFSHRYLTWAEFHGSAIAATAHLLGLRRCYVPGSLSTGNALPYGSHPELDPLWSSESTELVYDAYDVSRVEKVRTVAASDTALRYLRVCNARDDTGYNCGRCEKCIRTLVSLRIWGHAGALPTFPAPLDLGDVATRRSHRVPELWIQNLEAARSMGHDLALITALERSLPSEPSTGTAQPPDGADTGGLDAPASVVPSTPGRVTGPVSTGTASRQARVGEATSPRSGASGGARRRGG